MWRRYSYFLAITVAALVVLPAISILNDVDGVEGSDPPTRYGFTVDWDTVAQPSSMAYSVATGDVDGANNDDIAVGLYGSVIIYTNNGGSSISFSLEKTIPLADYYITDLEIVDYDNDGDRDIIALGQSEYKFANDQNQETTITLGSFKVYYIENGDAGFTLDTSDTVNDVVYYCPHWYYFDGKLDLATGDFDKDNDVDAVVVYPEDTDGNTNTGSEGFVVMGFYFDSGSVSHQSLASHSNDNSFLWGHVRVKDMDENGYLDIVYTMGGIGLPDLELQVIFNTAGGFQSTYNAETIPTNSGELGKFSYSLEVGHFSGPSYLDVAVGVNYNAGGQTYGKDGRVWIIKQNNQNQFSLETMGQTFVEYKHFQHRGMAAGRLNDDDQTGGDLICFTKFDTNDDLVIDNFGVSYLRGQTATPAGFTLEKVYDTKKGNLDTDDIRAIALGNFDNDPNNFDDVVFVGSEVQAGFVVFPPNNPPELVSASMSPSPVLNNDEEITTINLTIKDEDGNWDLDKIVLDFTVIGLDEITIEKPTYRNVTLTDIGNYEFALRVPESVAEGNYDIPFEMYDRSDNGKNPQSNDTFLFRVEQYNRGPTIALENRTVYGMEDNTFYVEDIYDWFEDLDGDLLDIKMLNPSGVSVPEISNYVFTARMVNGSKSDPQDWALMIEPEPNAHHKDYDIGNVLLFKASDGVYESQTLELKVKILPVNDLPIIPPQGKPDSDFQYLLEQDDPASVPLLARDPADGDPDGKKLKFYFEYDQPSDSQWLECTEDGILSWDPRNEHVGSHKVTLWVNDSMANVSQVLWFNVSNIIDDPYFVSLSYGNQSYEDIPRSPGETVYEFTVYEHDEFNLTIVADDIDMHIGNQSQIFFRSNLTLGNNAYLEVDEDDPKTAYFHFWAEKKFGFPATVGDREPVETEILITDEWDPEHVISINIMINILNVNDPPKNVTIDMPEEGQVFEHLYRHTFSAGTVLDPDIVYGDNITYQWDFDRSDGFQVDAQGITVKHDFDKAGDFTVTLRVIDGGNNSVEATVNITVKGVKNETDWDNDGMPNDWEDQQGFDKLDKSDGQIDTDGDGWTNLQEYLNRTDPHQLDSDGDGVVDSEDVEPNNPRVWEAREKKEDSSVWIYVVIIIAVILLIILPIILIFYVITSRKRAEEEEEKRRKAEELAASMYEDQDLYADLPQMAQETPEAQKLPEQQEAPPLPQPDEELGDVFEGAGVLPSEKPEIEEAPQEEEKGEETEVSDDLSDLFD